MLKTLTTALLCFFLSMAFAQKKDTIVYYLNKSNKIVSSKDSAEYFAVILPPDTSADKNLSVIREYYKNGKIKLLGKVNSQSFKFQGPAISYFINGHKMNIKNYDDGLLVGDVVEYYPNGKLYDIKNIVAPGTRGTQFQLNECRDSTGNVLAENGNGKWIEFLDETIDGIDFAGRYIEGEVNLGIAKGEWRGDLGDSIVMLRVYKNGILVMAKDSDMAFNNKTHSETSKLPGFTGGMESLGKFLGTHLRYPDAARAHNTQGRVIVSFVVEKDGSLNYVSAARDIGDGCDEEAMRVVKLSPRWSPGMVDGKPVRVAYSMPIGFTIDNQSPKTKKNVDVEKNEVFPEAVEMKWDKGPFDGTVTLSIYKSGNWVSVKDSDTSITNRIYSSVDRVPEFPGGLESFGKFLGTHIHYPVAARANNTQGRVIISFVVEMDGSLTHVGVARGVGDGCSEEAVRVVKLSPNWAPGILNGQIVRTAYSIPISFALNQ